MVCRALLLEQTSFMTKYGGLQAWCTNEHPARNCKDLSPGDSTLGKERETSIDGTSQDEAGVISSCEAVSKPVSVELPRLRNT